MLKTPHTDTRSLRSEDNFDERSFFEAYKQNHKSSAYDSDARVDADVDDYLKYPKYSTAYSANGMYESDQSIYTSTNTRSALPKSPYVNEDPMLQSRGPPTVSKWKRPWFCWIISAVQVVVFLIQCGHAWKLTGSPIQLKPSFNIMIGPSVYNSINMGARYPYCMKFVSNVTDVVTGWPCPNTTSTAQLAACTLSELCGNGAQANVQPDQWWRFIVPIFLHAGLLHIAFNLMVQLRQGTQVEMDIGAHIFVPIYFAAGVGGYLFGGNFAGTGIASTGASGSIFSIISLSLLEHLYHWKQIVNPIRGLVLLLLDIVISLGLGLLPGVDNFSHIGGFLIGLLLGVALIHSPDSLRRKKTPYERVSAMRMQEFGEQAVHDTTNSMKRDKLNFFQDRSPWWWAFCLLRAICLTLTILSITLLAKV